MSKKILGAIYRSGSIFLKENAQWGNNLKIKASSVFTTIGVARGGKGVRPLPPIQMLSMIKMSQNRLGFLQFRLASSRTTVHAYSSN